VNEQQGLDAFSKRYLALLAIIALLAGAWWLLSLDSRVSELNDVLDSDSTLAEYPYRFRVLSLENGVAEMSSPRSAQLSATRGLRVMFPELVNAGAVSPEMMAAQEHLASVQSRAAELITAQPDVRRVRWVLDEQWLSGHGIYVQ
jgi:hypothetical protein